MLITLKYIAHGLRTTQSECDFSTQTMRVLDGVLFIGLDCDISRLNIEKL
jgi:hypothetical protein